MPEKFQDRASAGRALADMLSRYRNWDEAMVLALPRGGLPVAFEVAASLNLPLDVLVVRKLGVPGWEELAFGAIAFGGITVFNEDVVASTKITDPAMMAVIERERNELIRRERAYRGDRPPPQVAGKTVFIVDDGLATGATMRAAVAAVRAREPRRIIVAAPVASRATCKEFDKETGECCVCVMTPEPFYGVGLWYDDFGQTTDEEVCRLLEKAAARSARKATVKS